MTTPDATPLPLTDVELLGAERVTIGETSFLRIRVQYAGQEYTLTTQQRIEEVLREATNLSPTGAMIGAAVAAFLGVKKGAEERAANGFVADIAGQAAAAQLQTNTKHRLRKLGRRHR